MPRLLALAALGAILCASETFAGLPDPMRCGCELTGQSSPCQFRFRADGGLDCLTMKVTLRDAFDNIVHGCSTSATIALRGPKTGGGACGYAAEPGEALCVCDSDGLKQSGYPNVSGALAFVWKCLGGRGTAEVCVTAHCIGNIVICCSDFDFTSPDLDGSCESGGSSTSIVDLGLWASCLPPSAPCESADYDCDCSVDIVDLGLFAGGLGVPCSCPQ